MPVKDYYKILELSPGATEKEIKRSFRRLALRYHPDKNQGNKYSEAWFRELQEAYNTLTDPVKKDAYLQERWLAKSQGKAMARAVPLTPDTILAEARELAIRVEQMDHFRMDHEQLANSLLQVLEDERMDVLLTFNDNKANHGVAIMLLKASSPVSFKLLPPFYKRLKMLCQHDADFLHTIGYEMQKRKREYWWSRNQWWVMLLATLLLCGGMYLFAVR